MVARLGTLPLGVVLARLLGPHAFGTFAVALVALIAVLSFNDLSVSLAIVRWEGDPAEIAPTVATLSVATSLVVYAACFLCARPFASAMGVPAAAGVIRVLALNVVVDGIVATPAALLQRQFRQGRKMIADQVNNWLGVAVSVGLAWHGFGAMSLAVGRMAGAVASAVLFLYFSPLPLRFGFNLAKARALLRFGLPLAGASIVVFTVTNIDQLVVGHLLGVTALGFYALALNLASWPVTMLSAPTRSVAPAVFARLQDDRVAMCRGFLSAAGLLAAVALPVCLVISGSSSPLVQLFYGRAWAPAATALTWLVMLSAVRIGYELIYDFLVVLARSRVLLIIQLAWLTGLAPALVLGARADGIAGAAMAEVAVAACVVFPCYLSELTRIGVRRRDLAERLWLPLVIAAAVGGAAAAAAAAAPALRALAISAAAALAGFALLARRVRRGVATIRLDMVHRPGLAEAAADPAASRLPGTVQRAHTRIGGGSAVATPGTAGSVQ
jgi:PST family polysaccharide transporter